VQERPHFKRSALWQREREITAWVQEGYSFRQIATKVSGRWLQEWYAKNVGRRRARAQIASGRGGESPTNSTSLPPAAKILKSSGKGPPQKSSSPAPEAFATTAPIDPDFSALFQSQFKRPRK
jgi:hypothetical protein